MTKGNNSIGGSAQHKATRVRQPVQMTVQTMRVLRVLFILSLLLMSLAMGSSLLLLPLLPLVLPRRKGENQKSQSY